jgi:AraC-like DNA-binding protein
VHERTSVAIVGGGITGLALGHQLSRMRVPHILFEAEGKTFTEYVHQQRLREAHRMLTSPAYAATRIGDIAHAIGFSEQSTFNRLFRQAFGATPSEIREASRANRHGKGAPATASPS